MNILFECKFGSHLYGTDTPTSDLDFKGIHMNTFEEILLKKSHESIVSSTGIKDQRNTKDDVDVEYKELRRFLRDCMQGQTYALDMLFAPKDMWIKTSPEWEFIIKHRQKLLSKNVEPYVGYCRQQAGKYGLKGSRLGELKRVIEHLEKFNDKDLLGVALKSFIKGEFAYMEELPVTNDKTKTGHFLNVLGKKFQDTVFIHQVLSALNILNEKYGQRAELAMKNEGIDWKAISHAYRCCYQLIELAKKSYIWFPLKQAEYLKKIKAGGLEYSIIQDELFNLMQEAIKAVEESTLPSQPDIKFWDEFIISTYKRYI